MYILSGTKGVFQRVIYSTLNPFVLVVDDQAAVADTLTLVLKQGRYLAVACYDAGDALTICRAITPDIMLVDVLLGATSGIDLAIAVRTIEPNCKILLMSGDNSTEEVHRRADGVVAEFPLLAKPIPPAELLGLLRDSGRPRWPETAA